MSRSLGALFLLSSALLCCCRGAPLMGSGSASGAGPLDTVGPVVVIAPNGGETWRTDSTVTIAIAAQKDLSVIVSISQDGGLQWSDLFYGGSIDLTAGETLSIPFKVPDSIDMADSRQCLKSDECLIRVADYDIPAVHDVSDGYFSVQNGPALCRKPSGSCPQANVCPITSVWLLRPTSTGMTWDLSGRRVVAVPAFRRSGSLGQPVWRIGIQEESRTRQ
jgi:hypothetical protein